MGLPLIIVGEELLNNLRLFSTSTITTYLIPGENAIDVWPYEHLIRNSAYRSHEFDEHLVSQQEPLLDPRHDSCLFLYPLLQKYGQILKV